MNSLALLGAGGHAASCLALAREVFGTVQISGYVSLKASKQGELSRLEFFVELSEFKKLAENSLLVNGLGLSPGLSARTEQFLDLVSSGFIAPNLVSPRANLWSTLPVDQGIQVFPGAFIGSSAEISSNAVISVNAIVEHDTSLAEGCFIGPGAILLGGVRVGPNSLIGAGATVLPGVKLGKGVTVGAGAVITKDVQDGGTLIGVPGKSNLRE